ncbi:MAG TPA: acetate/propionate family kinase [Xanthobacteraceae bacterium]|nr:acetate/propionate family kinase [Xanthobacteraceae bacterium]
MSRVVLVLNAGSSSLKFQVFEAEGERRRIYRGLFEGLGGNAHFIVRDSADVQLSKVDWPPGEGLGHEGALRHLTEWLSDHREGYRMVGVGHRVVHGGADFSRPVLITPEVIAALEKLVPLAPLHQPHNLEPIRIIASRRPDLPQVACFDTAFHHGQPEIATLFALPKAMHESGVRRYGFHGLSYAYVASAMPDYDPRLGSGRVVVAHLGNGASLCAISAGRSIASTMGFSAIDGLPMGTRCGALDPAVVFYMIREMGLSPEEAERTLYTQSGLLGVSGLSNDMRKLRAVEATNADARRAIDLFVYRIAREIGSLTAALGGLDALVFTAGIGENDATTRAAVLRASAFAGFELDEAANASGGPRITGAAGPSAWVIPTDEERTIAQDMTAMLDRMPLPSAS